jgi:hypothetical protein
MGRMMRVFFPLVAIVLGLAVAPPAFGDSLTIRVATGQSGLSEVAIRQAIEAELRGSADTASGELDIDLDARRHAVVTFHAASGRVTKREIDLPEEPDRAKEAIALLSGNLARDEAHEILAELERDRAAQGETAEPAATEAPPATPPPATPPPATPPPTTTPKSSATPPRADATPDRQTKQESAPAEHDEAGDDGSFRFDASLWDAVSTLDNAKHRRVNFELGFYSRIGSLDGVMFGLGYGRVERDADGVAMEVGYTRIRRRLRGVAMAFGVTSSNELHGAQLAAGANAVTGNVEGFTGAAGLNLVGGKTEGASVAMVNSLGALDGGGIALVNVGGKVRGFQLGLVNVATDVSGTQIGLVNVSDKVDGIPLGIVNVVAQGRTQIVSWADSDAFAHVGVKYENSGIYTLIAVGHAITDSGRTHSRDSAGSFAIGGDVPIGAGFYAGLDAMYTSEVENDFGTQTDGPRHVGRYRLQLGYDPSHTISAFVAGGVEHVTVKGGSTTVRPYGAVGLAVF